MKKVRFEVQKCVGAIWELKCKVNCANADLFNQYVLCYLFS